MNTFVFDKLTTVFPFLRKEKTDQKDIDDLLRDLGKKGFLQGLKDSGEEPEKFATMTMAAFEDAVTKMRPRFKAALDLMVKEVKKS